MQLLKQKANEAADAGNSKFLEFYRFSENVSQELSQINSLFPEFTPHDSAYHVSSLHRITDSLLGERILLQLNLCELFILFCSLYGHDWGMAVSKDEKNLILTGINPTERQIPLLTDEKETLKNFATREGLSLNPEGYFNAVEEITLEQWREYVRTTHASRARVRIEWYFQEIDEHLGKALGIVCEGHWYKIEKVLQLSTNLSIAGFSINIRALTAYIRLIDLFDIANNRTPFKLWKFVNPRNSVSRMEWKKHQAINPITVVEGGNYREIQVHGSTKDYDVFAALEDLRIWISKEFQENKALLKDLGNYDPVLVDLDWKIDAEGFEPLSVQFEFDRDNMFNILSSEIYDEDPYVFIRELLQNAIDATNHRKLLLFERGYSIPSQAIFIDVTHLNNGNAIFSITDEGIGMDEWIISNYLAVAGKSYYRSQEFEKLKLKMDPISRFGIGLLSCFMVANEIQIKTYQDPVVGEAYFYEINILDFQRQFHIKKLKTRGNVGTTVTVKVLSEKWRKGAYAESEKLKVTEYLKAIAGFVREPILVTEDGIKTLIVHPSASPQEYDYLKKENTSLHQLSFLYDRPETFSDYTVGPIDEILKEEIINVNIEDAGYSLEGGISFFIPHQEGHDIFSSRRQPPGLSGIHLGSRGPYQVDELPIYWKSKENPNEQLPGLSSSSKLSTYSRLYYNGILVSDYIVDLSQSAPGVPPPKILINITKGNSDLKTNISRTNLNKASFEIPKIVQSVYEEYFFPEFENIFEKLNPKEKIFFLTKLLTFYHFSTDRLVALFPVSKWPIVHITSDRVRCSLKKYSEIAEIAVLPSVLMKDQFNFINFWGGPNWLDGVTISTECEVPGETIILNFSKLANRYVTPLTFTYLHTVFYLSQKNLEVQNWHFCLTKNSSIVGYAISRFNPIQEKEEYLSPKSFYTPLKFSRYSFQVFNGPFSTKFCALFIDESFIGGSFEVESCIFNFNHKVSGLLSSIINYDYASIPNEKTREIKFIIDTMPLKGYLHNYSPNEPRVQRLIIEWVRNVCLAAIEINVIPHSANFLNLNEQDFIVVEK